MTKKQQQPVAVKNLLYFASKIRPLEDELGKLEDRKDEIEDELEPLQRQAQELASEAFDEIARFTVQRWKSEHGDEELTLEWVDEQFKEIPAEVLEFANHGDDGYRKKQARRDLMRFFTTIRNILENETEEEGEE